MKHLLSRNTLTKLYESFKIDTNDIVYIHHNITDEVVKVKIISKTNTKCTVQPLDDSDYSGQPPFTINRYEILGIV
jgi:hypothetical protein